MTGEETHFIVLAPLDLEVTALADVFGFDVSAPEVCGDGIRWYQTVIRRDEGMPLNVRIVRLAHQGELHAAVTTTKLVLEWKPWCVVSFGIAGGLCGEDISLRDVLVADSVYYYEPAKETVVTIAPEKPANMGRNLVRESANVSSVVQEEPTVFSTSSSVSAIAGAQSPPKRRSYKVRVGPVASGEKLIADLPSPSRERILKINRKMLAVEKEAAGVAAAVRGLPELPDTHLLVVKGISDDATVTKNQKDEKQIARDRKVAARNAAEILFQTVLASTPRMVDSLNADAARKVLDLTKQCLAHLPAHMVIHPNETELSRVLFPPTILPPVYYHWRALTSKLHWVDFCVLRAFSRLGELGFPVFPLVTEGKDGRSIPAGFSREAYAIIVDAVCGSQVTWYSEIDRYRAQYLRYAEISGLDRNGIEAIRDSGHHWGLRSGCLVLEQWLQYVAWASRNVGRCLILTYEKHVNAYMEIRRVLTLNPLVVGVNIQIDCQPGKFDHPWSEIHIDPPNYESILDWLKTYPPAEHVAEFCRYVSLGRPPLEQLSPSDMQDLNDMPNWRNMTMGSRVNEKDLTFWEAVSELVSHLREWNSTFFSSYVVANSEVR